MPHLPTVKQLRYFVALAEQRHFRRAAETCFVSQSAFSIAIRELETALEARLVDRTNRKVTITRTGQEVAVQARRCLRDIEDLAELARAQRDPLAGPLHLGVIPTIAPFLLPRALPRLRRACPDLKLYLHEDTTLRIHAGLMAGRLDLLLLALPCALRNVEVLPLFRDPFRLACRKGTRLVDPERPRLDRLNAGSVLLLEDGHCLRGHALAACRLRNAGAVSPFSATSLLTLVEMVDADLGITFLPEMAEGAALLRHTRIGTWPVPGGGHREIGLAWRRGGARAAEFARLGELLRENRR